MEPVSVSLLYRAGLLFVAVAMVLLPVCYVGLIGAAAYGVYYHATANVGILESVENGGNRLSILAVAIVYFAPIVAGVVLVFFMLKPLLARGRHRTSPLTIDPRTQPTLCHFVDRLCRTVKAPVPSRIEVTTDVNAAASFRRGFLSFFRSDLTLTIGLPLVAGLTLRQLAGVLAHELGHFTQGTAMRFTYVSRTVNYWFARVVYERDRWDEWLTVSSQESALRFRIMLYLARFSVWATRLVLHVLMLIGHAISCFMLRQMEFGADRYAIRLAGSDAFAATATRMHFLAVGSRIALRAIERSYEQGYLPDDLPAIIVESSKALPTEVTSKIRKQIRTQPTSLLDTHPSDRDRIENARREGSSGVFQINAPASVLLDRYPDLCRSATLRFYQEVAGPLDGVTILPSGDFLGSYDVTELSGRG